MKYDKFYDTTVLKGFGLLLMFIHHLFAFPNYYVSGIAYPELVRFTSFIQISTGLAAGIFAFITGFFYAQKKHDVFYSVKKSTDVWLNYALFFILFVITTLILGCFPQFTPIEFILELLGITTEIVRFGWYILFFITAIFFLPLYSKISKNNIVLEMLYGVVLPLGIIAILKVIVKSEIITDILIDLRWIQAISCGYIFGKHDLFNKISNAVCKKKTKKTWLKAIVYSLMIILPFSIRGLIPYHPLTICLDFIYTPILMAGLFGLVKTIKAKKTLLPFYVLGKYSLLMWLFHSIFFNCCKEYTQRFLYISSYPLLVLLWGLIISLIAAILLSYPINYIVKQKNKLLNKIFSQKPT